MHMEEELELDLEEPEMEMEELEMEMDWIVETKTKLQKTKLTTKFLDALPLLKRHMGEELELELEQPKDHIVTNF